MFKGVCLAGFGEDRGRVTIACRGAFRVRVVGRLSTDICGQMLGCILGRRLGGGSSRLLRIGLLGRLGLTGHMGLFSCSLRRLRTIRRC